MDLGEVLKGEKTGWCGRSGLEVDPEGGPVMAWMEEGVVRTQINRLTP